MSDVPTYQEFGWSSAQPLPCHGYLTPILLSVCPPLTPKIRVLDVGCGNGLIAGEFVKRGCQVVGIDLSSNGIEIARAAYPTARFELLAADSDILEKLSEEPFDIVLSTEVVEHLYDPPSYMKGCYAATKRGGTFICSTPYHGYLKNLVLSLSDSWDKHVHPLLVGGHIKFFSVKTLSMLMTEHGFVKLKFAGSGRFPFLWKSMLIRGERE